jgi:hypothetical protein
MSFNQQPARTRSNRILSAARGEEYEKLLPRLESSLWLIYGFIKGEAAIIVTNAVTLVLGAARAMHTWAGRQARREVEEPLPALVHTRQVGHLVA